LRNPSCLNRLSVFFSGIGDTGFGKKKAIFEQTKGLKEKTNTSRLGQA